MSTPFVEWTSPTPYSFRRFRTRFWLQMCARCKRSRLNHIKGWCLYTPSTFVPCATTWIFTFGFGTLVGVRGTIAADEVYKIKNLIDRLKIADKKK